MCQALQRSQGHKNQSPIFKVLSLVGDIGPNWCTTQCGRPKGLHIDVVLEMKVDRQGRSTSEHLWGWALQDATHHPVIIKIPVCVQPQRTYGTCTTRSTDILALLTEGRLPAWTWGRLPLCR